jgi:hypothetical protein
MTGCLAYLEGVDELPALDCAQALGNACHWALSGAIAGDEPDFSKPVWRKHPPCRPAPIGRDSYMAGATQTIRQPAQVSAG